LTTKYVLKFRAKGRVLDRPRTAEKWKEEKAKGSSKKVKHDKKEEEQKSSYNGGGGGRG